MENKNILKSEQTIKISWEKIQSDMKDKFGKDIFDSWLRKISFEEEFNNYVLMTVTTRFIRDWITSRYLDQILSIVRSYKSEINRIELSVNEEQNNGEVKKIDHKLKDNSLNNVSFIKYNTFQYNILLIKHITYRIMMLYKLSNIIYFCLQSLFYHTLLCN